MAELTANELDALLALEALHDGYKSTAYQVETNAIVSQIGDDRNLSYEWVDRRTFEQIPAPWLKIGLLTESDTYAILIERVDGVYEGNILYSFQGIPLTFGSIPVEAGNDTGVGGEGNNNENTNAPAPTTTNSQNPQDSSEPDNSPTPETGTSGNNNQPVTSLNPVTTNPVNSQDSQQSANPTPANLGTSGNENLTGDAGNNTLDGNAGDDAISGAGGEDRLFGNLGNDLISGGEESDLINGNQGNDTINGNQGNDTLHGGKGDDVLHGGKDNDLISGDLGNDQVFGDLGNDTLTGGDGKDTLTGGAGQDFFLFEGKTAFSTDTTGIDVLTDFTSQTDKIILDKTLFSALANVAVGVLSSENFTVVSSDALAATGTGLIVYNSTTGALFYNQNGAESGFGTGGQFATLLGTTVLTADAFLVQP